jgi:hypothetical protein
VTLPLLNIVVIVDTSWVIATVTCCISNATVADKDSLDVDRNGWLGNIVVVNLVGKSWDVDTSI